jgi:hypothetical protein
LSNRSPYWVNCSEWAAPITNTGLKVNSKESLFGQPKLEYLGYWISRQEGIQPIAKKVEAIQNITT